MGRCVSCGSSISDEQKICSMCYGDPSYGRDGYYEEWLQNRENQQQNTAEEQEE